MAIFDLTGGKYPSLNTQDLRKAVYEFNAPNTIHQRMVESQERDEIIPVFLVETAQSNTLVTIPETHFAVKVPEDQWLHTTETNPGESLYNKLRLWELGDLSGYSEESERKKGNLCLSIVDIMGVYFSDNDPIVPNRVFVWVDKIYRCASGDIENAYALLLQVILHELTHAFLDVTRIGKKHNTLFTYSHPAYRFIEEAFANGLSLHMCMPILTTKQQLFLEQFVLNQGRGYSEGVPIFKSYPLLYVTRISIEWRWSKSFFNKDIAGVIYKALLCINLNSGLWLRPLGSGLRDVHTNIIRAQRNNTVNTTNTSKV